MLLELAVAEFAEVEPVWPVAYIQHVWSHSDTYISQIYFENV